MSLWTINECEHGWTRSHGLGTWTVDIIDEDMCREASRRPATFEEIIEFLTNEHGAEKHDDVALQFLVGDQVIYSRSRGDYLIVPIPGGTQ